MTPGVFAAHTETKKIGERMSAADRPTPLMRIKLTDERREQVRHAVRHYYVSELDEEISDFRLDELIDLFVHELGPPVYNQAIRDAHSFLEDKLVDLEGEFYEPEPPPRSPR